MQVHHILAEITKGSGLRIPFLEKVASVLEQAPAEVWVLLVRETIEKTNFCPLRASSVQEHEPYPEIMEFWYDIAILKIKLPNLFYIPN